MSARKGSGADPPAGGAAGTSPVEAERNSLLRRAENALSVATLCGMALLPLLEIVGRRFWRTVRSMLGVSGLRKMLLKVQRF